MLSHLFSVITWEITTKSPLWLWLVRHCGWILSRHAARSYGWTGYSGYKGRDCTAGISMFGGATWCKLPNTGELTKLDDWRTAIWLEKSDRSDEHIIGLEVEGKRWNEKALKMVTSTPWHPR